MHALGDDDVIIVLVLNKLPPFHHNLFHRGSVLGVLLPTALDELPHLASKPYHLSVSWHLRPTPLQDKVHYRFVPLPLERHPTGGDLHRKHREGKYVGGF